MPDTKKKYSFNLSKSSSWINPLFPTQEVSEQKLITPEDASTADYYLAHPELTETQKDSAYKSSRKGTTTESKISPERFIELLKGQKKNIEEKRREYDVASGADDVVQQMQMSDVAQKLNELTEPIQRPVKTLMRGGDLPQSIANILNATTETAGIPFEYLGKATEPIAEEVRKIPGVKELERTPVAQTINELISKPFSIGAETISKAIGEEPAKDELTKSVQNVGDLITQALLFKKAESLQPKRFRMPELDYGGGQKRPLTEISEQRIKEIQDANARREIEKSGKREHQRIPQGEDLPTYKGEIREGESGRAGGGGIPEQGRTEQVPEIGKGKEAQKVGTTDVQNINRAKQILSGNIPTPKVMSVAKNILGKNYQSEFQKFLDSPNNKSRLKDAKDKTLELGLINEDFVRRTVASKLLGEKDINTDLFSKITFMEKGTTTKPVLEKPLEIKQKPTMGESNEPAIKRMLSENKKPEEISKALKVPIEEVNKIKEPYFTKEEAPPNVKENFKKTSRDFKETPGAKESVPKELYKTLEDGTKVYLVDGTYIRDNIDLDWTMGGHEYVYPKYIPKGEVWLDKDINKIELDNTLRHELTERQKMVSGEKYDAAHEIANKKEIAIRQGVEQKPLESKPIEKIEQLPKTEKFPDNEKKKLFIKVMSDYGKFPLNSPELGKYRNTEMPTTKVISALKSKGLLEDVKKQYEKFIKGKTPEEQGQDFELLSRITLKKAEEPLMTQKTKTPSTIAQKPTETGVDEAISKGSGRKLYESLREKEIYKIDELSKETGKSSREVAEAMHDLYKQGLILRAEGGFKPSEEFKTILDDISKNPKNYDTTFDKLYSNPIGEVAKGISKAINILDDMYQKALGDRIYKGVSKLIKKATPEKTKEYLINNYGLPELYIKHKAEARDGILRFNQLAKEIGDELTYREGKEKFTEAEQKRLAQGIRGSIINNPLLKARANRAIAEIKRLEELGKELDVLPVETYNTKLPRKRIAQLLDEKHKLEKDLQRMLDTRERIKINSLLTTANQQLKNLQKTRQILEDRIKYNKRIEPKTRLKFQNRIENIDKQIAQTTGQKLALEGKLKNIVLKRDLSPRMKQLQDQIDVLDRSIKTSFKHGGEGYFKRVYLSKEQEARFSKYGVYKPTRLDLTSAIKRKDIPFEVRREMGEILTASYPVSKGIMLEGKDISLGRFFEAVSENPDWIASAEKPGFVKMPDTPKLGKLKGLWVEERIAKDINDIIKLTSPEYTEKFLSQIQSIWKATKVIMNPATHLRNIMSNSVMLDFSGVSHLDQLRLLPEAIKAIKGEGEYAKQFKVSLLDTTTFNQAELGKYLDVIAEEPGFWKLSLPDKITKLYGKVSLVDTKIGETMSKVYQFEEVLGKAVKFISELEKGKSISEAKFEANKWLFDYGDVPKAVEWLRRQPLLGSPFITWSAKAFPRVLEAAITRPISFWKYPVIFSALTKAALNQLGMSKDEWEEIRKTLPDRVLKGQWLLLPFRDDNKNIQMLDLSYMLPYKDVYDIIQSGQTLIREGEINTGEDIVEGVTNLFNSPVLTAFTELSANKNRYTNQPIWSSVDTPIEQAQKTFDYMYKLFMPSLSPEIPGFTQGGYGYHKLRSVITGRPDYYGRTFSLAAAIGSSLGGIKTSPVEPEKNKERRALQIQSEIADWGTKRNQLLRDQTIDIEDRITEAGEIDKKIDNLRTEKENLGLTVDIMDQVMQKEISSLQRRLSKVTDEQSRQKLQEKINRLKISLYNEKYPGKGKRVPKLKGRSAGIPSMQSSGI